MMNFKYAFYRYALTIVGSVSLLFYANANQPSSAKKATVDAFSQCERLGRGTNYSNLLYRGGHFGVSVYSNDNWDKETERKEFELMKEIGLKHVRICVGPFGFAGPGPEYTISKDFYDRVDWTINTALACGLAVIINQHEYNVMAEDPIGLKEEFLVTWKQMAEHYKDFPDNVYFEILNEPHGKLTPDLWNQFFSEALKVIRASNPDRTVLIGPGTWNNIESIPYLKLPEDDRNIIVEFHYYYPFKFTHQGTEWAEGSDAWVGTKWTGSDAEKKAVTDDFKVVIDWAKLHNRPLYLGEFGAFFKGDMESRIRWYKFIIGHSESNNIAWAPWDLMGPYFGIFNESAMSWIEPLKSALFPSSK